MSRWYDLLIKYEREVSLYLKLFNNGIDGQLDVETGLRNELEDNVL